MYIYMFYSTTVILELYNKNILLIAKIVYWQKANITINATWVIPSEVTSRSREGVLDFL